MLQLIRTLWYICLLRDGPQDIPAGKSILPWVLLMHLLVGTLYGSAFSNLIHALYMELASLLVTVAFIRVALLLSNKLARFEQSASALLGSDVIISAVGILLALILGQALGLESLLSSSSVLLFIWGYIVSAHIFRHTFEITFAGGLGMTFLYFMVVIMAVGMLQGSTGS
ncbi:MAG: hypothetical protein HUJ30_08350 [Gammaproteobacteria bacterium]|nr:hypothetical protein [Gammaproteobacteria bacterium]